MKPGKVYLIGAGPGDVELLTLKAVRAIGEADVLLLDDLINREILQFARPQAIIHSVGKRGGCKSTEQAEIERQTIELARSGQCVARLKGGDPFIFGRGGEELTSILQAGLQVEVIPGITAGIAVPASIGIPLTHRDHCASVTFATGHRRDKGSGEWQALAKSAGTLVIYMAMSNLRDIVGELLAAGLAPSTPAAAIQNGTLPGQKQLISTVAALPDCVERARLDSPSIIVIGSVISVCPAYEQLRAASVCKPEAAIAARSVS